MSKSKKRCIVARNKATGVTLSDKAVEYLLRNSPERVLVVTPKR